MHIVHQMGMNTCYLHIYLQSKHAFSPTMVLHSWLAPTHPLPFPNGKESQETEREKGGRGRTSRV